MNEQKIPKVIHYCWFGGNPLPELAVKCIESWKKYCPDYEIKEWNESNFDINCCDYVKEAYEAKKWAFVSDYARLHALVNYGGIYMDTDVEVVKPLDNFLSCSAVSGFESNAKIPTGFMACEKGHPLFREFLDEYKEIHFKQEDGSFDMTTNVIRITRICQKYGFVPNNQKQVINGFTLYPKDFFCPKDYLTKKITLTQNTHTIHHFDGSWLSEEEKYVAKLRKVTHKFLPSCIEGKIAVLIASIKYRGITGAVKRIDKYFRKKRAGK